MKNREKIGKSETILFISHDASRTGAPIALLDIIRWLRANIPNQFRIILRQGGPLEPLFKELGEVVNAGESEIGDDHFRDVGLIYSNTITNGCFLELAPYGNIPILTHVHEMGYVIELHGTRNLNEVKQQTVHFIACSKATTETLTGNYGIESSMISRIPSVVSLSDVINKSKSKDPLEIRRSLGISSKAFVVLGCGTQDLRKGIDLYIQLAAYCARNKPASREMEFLWIGSRASSPALDMLQKDARQLGENIKLRFLGEYDNPYPYIAAADLFCLPSREDPFPLVMMESGALGKPTIAFRKSGGAEEYCQEGGGFLVPYLDIFDMGNCIIKLMSDEKKISVAGNRARKLIKNKYNIEVTGPKYVRLIERFLRKNAACASGIAQLFIPSVTGYSEEASIHRQVQSSGWNRMSISFTAQGPNANSVIRFDPIDKIAVIEVAKIVLKTDDGRIIWQMKNAKDFRAVRVEGSATRISDTKMLKLLSYGPDPVLFLPEFEIDAREHEFKFDINLRADGSWRALAAYWPQLLRIYLESGGAFSDSEQERSRFSGVLDNIEGLGIDLLFGGNANKERHTYVWGAGLAGRQVGGILVRHGLEFQGFIDRDQSKEGQKVMEHTIYGPAILKQKIEERPFIIIGSQFHRQISQQLHKMGFVRGLDYIPSPFLQEELKDRKIATIPH